MMMENDEFKIPDKYQKMSFAQLDRESKKVLEQIKSSPQIIRRKKKAARGQKDITFYI